MKASGMNIPVAVFVITFFTQEIECYSAQDEIDLKRILIGQYIDVLPSANQSERIVVHLAYTLQSILELNSKQQSMSLSGNLQLMWKANLMIWNASHYGGLDRFHVKPSLVWTPTINVGNSVSKESKIGTDNFLVIIENDGTVTWYPDASVRTQCSMGALKFPFDVNHCDFVFEAKIYPMDRLHLIASRSELAMHLFQENGEWELLEHRVRNGKNLNRVVGTIVFKRRVAYHVINTILPVLLLSILNVLVFVLPPEAGEKMSLSITVLLAYAVFLSVFNKNMPTISTSVSLLATRETAFIYAILSAGVVHAVTESCSAGNLTDCSCDVSRQGMNSADGWSWGGCSDNINYGLWFSKNCVDAPETTRHTNSRNIQNKMNLHNNEVGRQVIEQNMRHQCRCHGVSGSCAVKTCWMRMPNFFEIGRLLKEKYDSSVEIAPRSKKRLRARDRRHKKRKITRDQLVHLNRSPNYCRPDPANGILGTRGRICNRTSTGADSCDLLCCGRGYNTQVVRYVERCHCKFHYCCYVTCKTCETMIDKHTCK